MAGFWREHSGSLAFSVLLHAAIAGALLVGALISVNKTMPTTPLPLPIDGVVIDSQVLSAAQRTLTERAEQEAARVKAAADARAAAEAAAKEKAAADLKQAQDDAAAQAQEQAEAQAKAKAATQQSAAKAAAAVAEQQRVDDAKRRAADADKAAAADRAAAAKRAADAQHAEEVKRAEQQKREADAKAADDAKRAADAKAKSEREAELKRQLAEEERVSAVQSGPLRDQYIAQLQARIQRAWIRLPSASVLDCLVQVTQLPGGEVTNAQVTQCNGDAAARQSIVDAVYRASPLPSPPDPALFMKSFSFHFHPDQ